MFQITVIDYFENNVAGRMQRHVKRREVEKGKNSIRNGKQKWTNKMNDAFADFEQLCRITFKNKTMELFSRRRV